MSQKPNWQRRRAEILQAACRFIAAQLQTGAKTMRAIRAAHRKFRYRSVAPGRRIRLSHKTLMHIWYRWRTDRDDSVFLLHYKPGRRRAEIGNTELRTIIETAVTCGLSIRQTLRKLGSHVSYHAICRRLPMREVTKLAMLQRRALKQRVALESERKKWLRQIAMS